MNQYQINRQNKLASAADHEAKSARFARSGDEIVEWINPADGSIVTRFRKQDPPLKKHKTGFTKAIEHKIKALDLRDEVRRMDARRPVVQEQESELKPWGRAQRILYNRGYKRLEDTCFGR